MATPTLLRSTRRTRTRTPMRDLRRRQRRRTTRRPLLRPSSLRLLRRRMCRRRAILRHRGSYSARASGFARAELLQQLPTTWLRQPVPRPPRRRPACEIAALGQAGKAGTIFLVALSGGSVSQARSHDEQVRFCWCVVGPRWGDVRWLLGWKTARPARPRTLAYVGEISIWFLFAGLVAAWPCCCCCAGAGSPACVLACLIKPCSARAWHRASFAGM